MDNKANIRVKSTNQNITNTQVDCHITSWSDTVLYSAIDQSIVLPPASLQYLTGEYFRNIYNNPDAPASVRVNFERPFVTPPKVVVFLNALDLSNAHNWRVKTSATAIDVNGFTLNIETWGDTTLYSAQACWIAYPEDETHIFSTSVNTMDVRAWDQPQLQQSKEITFNNVEFWKDPTVFIALNSIDIDCKANLRIKANVDGVSKTGLTWHIDSWYDTVLYSAGATIVAFNE
jgi:H-type lectin domain